jgi:ABC-type multidrug transport system ATPase subunit
LISISLHNIGKKFNREWIFRGISCKIAPGEKIAILGGNGSGKSTLLQLISGFIGANEGSIILESANGVPQKIAEEEYRSCFSFASPYIQLIDDFTAGELIDHVRIGKKFLKDLSTKEIIEIAQLDHAGNKFIRHYSSGMKQRLKLAIAILADTPVLLLDEPLSNLDKNGIEWYKQMIKNFTADKTVFVCSNAITEEFSFCTRYLDVTEYKKGDFKINY